MKIALDITESKYLLPRSPFLASIFYIIYGGNSSIILKNFVLVRENATNPYLYQITFAKYIHITYISIQITFWITYIWYFKLSDVGLLHHSMKEKRGFVQLIHYVYCPWLFFREDKGAVI